MKTERKTHIHEWQISYLEREYPIGMAGTTGSVLYAYLLCQCTEVRRVVVSDKQKEVQG